MAKNPLIRSYARKVSKPQPQKSAGILDDFAIRKNVATKEGTIEKVPVNNSDIVNKLALDTAVAAIDLTPYWKNDGTATATGNWNIGTNSFESGGNFITGTGGNLLTWATTGGVGSEGKIDSVGRLMVGTNTVGGKVTILSETEQLRLNYSDDLAAHFTVDENGDLEIEAEGANISFYDNDISSTGSGSFGTLTDGTFSVTGGAITGASGSNSQWTNDEGYLTSANPAGATTQIQYNNSGAFGASSDFTWNDATKELTYNGKQLAAHSMTADAGNIYFSENLFKYGRAGAGDTTASFRGLYANVDVVGSAAVAYDIGTVIAFEGYATVRPDTGKTATAAYAFSAAPNIFANGRVTDMTSFRCFNRAVLGDATSSYGIYFFDAEAAGAVIDNSYGLYIYSVKGTNAYGVYIADTTAGIIPIFANDSQPITLGTGKDSSIQFVTDHLSIKANDITATDFISLESDTVFVGAGTGLPFGSMYGNEIAWVQAISQNTTYVVSDADIATGQLNLVTHDGDGKLTAAKAGVYKVDWSVTAEHSATGNHILWGIAINGTLQNDAQQHRETKTANAEYQVSGTGLIALTAGQYVEVATRSADATPGTATVSHVNLTIVQVGG